MACACLQAKGAQRSQKDSGEEEALETIPDIGGSARPSD